jgi:hypothetical protein
VITYDGAKITACLAEHGSYFDQQVEGVGWEVNGRMLAALGIHDWTGSNVWAHIAVSLPAREWIIAAAHFVFVTLGVNRVSMWVQADNRRCLRLMHVMGANLDYVMRQGHAGADVHLYVLWRGTGIHQRLINKLSKD